MGLYIDHPDVDKKEWLEKNALGLFTREVAERRFDLVGNGQVLVCLVDNVLFTAALCVLDDYELSSTLDLRDTRTKTFYLVDVATVSEIPGMKDRLIKSGVIKE